MNRTLLYLFFLALLLSAAACTSSNSAGQQAPAEMPTTSALFGEGGVEPSAAESEAAGLGLSEDTSNEAPANPFVTQEADEVGAVQQAEAEEPATPPPQATATAAASATPAAVSSRIVTETVFAESMADNWTLEHSQWVDHSRQALLKHRGEYALEFTPSEDFGTLLFAVDEGTEVKYDRSEVVGISFWINVGTKELPLDSLGITVLGSNEYPYYVEGDTSVESKFQPVFQETRLYFLDFNGPIPPNEWVQVELYLDALRYDPVYQYVTGFYIKNDRGVLRTMTIDDVELLLREVE